MTVCHTPTRNRSAPMCITVRVPDDLGEAVHGDRGRAGRGGLSWRSPSTLTQPSPYPDGWCPGSGGAVCMLQA